MEEKLKALIVRQGDRVYRMAFSICPNDVDDVWQEVFLKWLRAKPVFPDEARERAWILKVTANLCRDRLQTPWNKRREDLSESFPAPAQDGENLRDLIEHLPKDLRAPVFLHYYEGYSTGSLPCSTMQLGCFGCGESIYRLVCGGCETF